jgi:hypothetical protein
MSGLLPERPDLNHLRREARALQRSSYGAGALPLAKAQALVARGYGFPSWPALKAAVERRSAPAAKSAAEVDAEALAALWFSLAEAEDLRPFLRSMAVGKGRMEAARAVMKRDASRYAAFVGAIVRGLGSRRDKVRFGCAHLLDQFGDTASRAPLARLMDDPVPRVRWAAMHALSCHACGEKIGPLEPHIRDRIVEATRSDPSPAVRRHAAAALALAHETSAALALREMLERETDAKTLRMVAWAHAEVTRPPRPDKAARPWV